MSLSYVNQVGAVDGLNQAAPGAFIPETFLRWAQDVLFDRVGYIRRRAPFKLQRLYSGGISPVVTYPNVANDRAIAVVSTLNPRGKRIFGIITTGEESFYNFNGVTDGKILFYDDLFRESNSSNIIGLPRDCGYDIKPALKGGTWISFFRSYRPPYNDPTIDVIENKYAQYYWYGGCGEDYLAYENVTFGTHAYTVLNGFTFSASSNKISKNSHGFSNGDVIEFVTLTPSTGTGFSKANDYYVVNASTNDFELSSSPGGTTVDILLNSTGTIELVENAGRVSYNNEITGTFDTSKITPGMFVFEEHSDIPERMYIGTIDRVTTTKIYLEKDRIRTHDHKESILNNLTGKIVLRNLRPFIHNHGRGLITKTRTGTTVTSGSVGTEGEGHFAAAALAGSSNPASSRPFALYRASDGRWIGDVDTVTNNAALSLSTQHYDDTIEMNADEYIAYSYYPKARSRVKITEYNVFPEIITYSTSTNRALNFGGVFHATYADYQWFGNAGTEAEKQRVVFSAAHNAESIDLSKDAADSIIIPGTAQMRGMATSSSGLLIFMADKTYIIRGNYRANFSLEELYPEGCLSSMSIVEYGGGVFWASRTGIMFYDGASVRNLAETNLGSYYNDGVRGFDVDVDRVYSFLHKDYLFVHFNSFDSSFNPSRYEPIYAEGIESTPAIQDFDADDWDPDFSVDDFNPVNNVPIFWEYIEMYKSIAGEEENVRALWRPGYSFSQAQFSSSNLSEISGLSYSSTTNGTINTADIDVGDLVIGDYIPGPYHSETSPLYQVSYITVATKVDADTITISSPAVLPVGVTSATVTIQVIPASSLGIKNPWGAPTSQYAWGPIYRNEGMTFAIYLPTGATSVLSNFDFRGSIKIDTQFGLRAATVANIVGTNNDAYPRLIDVDSILDTTNEHTISADEELIENDGKESSTLVKGPDFYIQTKHYTVGDPVLRKWFRQIFFSMFQLDGGIRMDIVDMEDNDRIDIYKKRHLNWELYPEALYTWNVFQNSVIHKLVSPNRSNWQNVEDLDLTWYEISSADFERRKKKISWRHPSAGFRLYQMNNYRPRNYQVSQRPHTVIVDSWNIGFKPMRSSRV